MKNSIHPSFIKKPSAALVSTQTIDGQDYIVLDTSDNSWVFKPSWVTLCREECAQPCLPQTWTIQFPDVDFGDCTNDCNKEVGFKLGIQRHSDFNLETLQDTLNGKLFMYPNNLSTGTKTGADLATWFANAVNQQRHIDAFHDLFGIDEVTVDPVNTDTIIITGGCPDEIFVYQLPAYNVELNISRTNEGQPSSYSNEMLRRQYPKDINTIPGEGIGNYPQDCETYCYVELRGCIQACEAGQEIELDNAVHMADVAKSITVPFFVNSQYQGYQSFINALIAAVPACTTSTLNLVGGFQTPGVGGVVAAGTVDLDTATLTFPGTFIVTNGSAELWISNATDAADLAAKLTAKYPSGGFAEAGGVITFSGDYASTGEGIVKIMQELS